jgi:ParB family transcriptional regulator, chromosome partitioning protein
MARKNILAGLMDEGKKFTAVNPEPDAAAEKHHAAYKGLGALGAVTRSIDALAAKADAAKAIEQKLAEGEVIIDLDPDLIEDSFVTDRQTRTDEQFEELVTAIRERGQDSPILVRPHPDKEGFYQIAFGHRRARAARELGRPVRAIVKRLADRDHVIAQGQENSARADLSFIERALFAAKLDALGFDRETIMSALSADKTTVSKMLSVTKRIHADILATIETARGVGRDRWHDLSTRLDDEDIERRALTRIGSEDYRVADPDQRFMLLERLTRDRPAAASAERPAKAEARIWARADGAVKAEIREDGKNFVIGLKARRAAAFGQYLVSNLDRLYEAFEVENNARDAEG